MRSPGPWFLVLLVVCIVGPYAIQLRAPTSRERWYLAATIGFIGWMLLAMTPLRST